MGAFGGGIELHLPLVFVAGLGVDRRGNHHLFAGAEEFDFPIALLDLLAARLLFHHAETVALRQLLGLEGLVGEEIDVERRPARAGFHAREAHVVIAEKDAFERRASFLVELPGSNVYVDDMQVKAADFGPFAEANADIVALAAPFKLFERGDRLFRPFLTHRGFRFRLQQKKRRACSNE